MAKLKMWMMKRWRIDRVLCLASIATNVQFLHIWACRTLFSSLCSLRQPPVLNWGRMSLACVWGCARRGHAYMHTWRGVKNASLGHHIVHKHAPIPHQRRHLPGPSCLGGQQLLTLLNIYWHCYHLESQLSYNTVLCLPNTSYRNDAKQM